MKKDNIHSESLIPRFYQTDANKKFLNSTLDQLIQSGSVEKINGFIGRKNAKVTKSNDVYVQSKSSTRQHYQLEPSVVLKNENNDIVFHKDYQDFINQLKILGADVSQHSRLTAQESYSWNPHFNWDMLVNYTDYYWTPHGPHVIEWATSSQLAQVQYELTLDNSQFYVAPLYNTTPNPTLIMLRNCEYVLNIDSNGHPISIKTELSDSIDTRYSDVHNNGIEAGQIRITPSGNTPSTLYYQSDIDPTIHGTILVQNSISTPLNLTHVIGATSVTINVNNTPVQLQNGMKFKFGSNTVPSKYATGEFYAEGVGSGVTFNAVSELTIDHIPEYSETYVVINREAPNRNLWSRFNKWFHKNVLTQSAALANEQPDLSIRAVRPIIEFNGFLTLANHGTRYTKDVDLIDRFTTKLSDINGRSDYYIDGVSVVSLLNKHSPIRVLFTNLSNPALNNKVFSVLRNNNVLLTIEEESPEENNTVLVKYGELCANTVYYYQNDWKLAQQKELTHKHSSPLFDVVDQTGISFGDKTKYPGSSFLGTKLFSYAETNNSTLDPVLNIAVSYRDVKNRGDILFDFNYETDSFSYQTDSVKTALVNTGLLKKQYPSKLVLESCWCKSYTNIMQHAIRIYKNENIITSNADNTALDYIHGNRYFRGDIVRFYDNNLYVVKDTVPESGTIESPPETVQLPQISLTEQNLTVVATVPSTFRFQVNDMINISTDIPQLHGVWSITNIISDTQFEFIVTEAFTSPVTQQDITAYKFKETDSWELFQKSDLKLNDFELDIFDNPDELDDLELSVYVNGDKVDNWSLQKGPKYWFVSFAQSVNVQDVVTLKALSSQPINNIGFYEIPRNLQNNYDNHIARSYTFSEIVEHVQSIKNNAPIGTPLTSVASKYGLDIVSHSGPMGLAVYYITHNENNIIRAIEQATFDYNSFKRNFVQTATLLGIDTDPVTHVNEVLFEINKNKTTDMMYASSDMVGVGNSFVTSYIVDDISNHTFKLSYLSEFSLSTVSLSACYVYLNGEQLLHNIDYEFVNNQIHVKHDLVIGDVLDIHEYENTSGCFIPSTPTKLGIWPLYEPKKYLDTTLVTPKYVIQHHDGSIILAFNDYRDDLILELEKRIFNNIKVQYNPDIFDISEIIPGYNSQSQYTYSEFSKLLAPCYFKWKQLASPKQLSFFDTSNSFTYNYSDYVTFDNKPVPGFWRGIYRLVYGTDRPHIAPWEMLGFSIKPEWWETEYGVGPWTSNNTHLWQDISQGIIRSPLSQHKKYIRPYILQYIPVDDTGKLLSPAESNIVKNLGTFTESSTFKFGDNDPVETSWVRSSFYPFDVIKTAILMHPAKTIGVLFDRLRISRSQTGHLVYNSSHKQISIQDIVLPDNSNNVFTSGLINYLVEHNGVEIQQELKQLKCQLSYRVGGFTSKEKFDVLLDSKALISTGATFLPKEDYSVFLNSSAPIDKKSYSGVIISRLPTGFEISGYLKSKPYFEYIKPVDHGYPVTVGGISEPYTIWQPNHVYSAGQLVYHLDQYYRVKSGHTSQDTFELSEYLRLAEVPIIGGRTALFHKTWNSSVVHQLAYGTKLLTIQDVVDFILGYSEWLKMQGFVFDSHSAELNEVLNWETSAKEFLFWTTQNWALGEDKWQEWSEFDQVGYGTIVRYNDEYYRALRNVPIEEPPITPDTSLFNETDVAYSYYEKMDGLRETGSPVISLSPAANKLVLRTENAVVDDIRNPFYEYELFSVNGKPISITDLDFNRSDNEFSCSVNTNVGIFGGVFYLIQKEHVVLLNNVSIFNDLLYNSVLGYKQDRLKVSGYVTSDWNGGFFAPGFVFDQAKITDWTPWQYYNVGDTVKYRNFYYSANSFIPGDENFNMENWTKLSSKPVSKLIPNWSYKALQFTDFHSLESENFDATQQRMAQHLIGYQRRQYLKNIIQNDVSEFKFYQGMLGGKGTESILRSLFDRKSNIDTDSLEVYEEWAIRTGQYGASNAFDTIEVTLDEQSFINNPQGFELVTVNPQQTVDFTIRHTLGSLYVAPTEVRTWPNVFPVTQEYTPFLRSAGSVNPLDVKLVIKHLDEIVQYSVGYFKSNDYIWVTFVDDAWSVMKCVTSNNKVVSATPHDTTTTVEFIFEVNLKPGEYLGVKDEVNDAFYKVVSCDNRILVLQGLVEFDYNSQLLEVVTSRIPKFDDLNDNEYGKSVYTKQLLPNDLIWAGGQNQLLYSEWKYVPVYTETVLTNPSQHASNDRFGKAIASSNDVLAASTETGNIATYTHVHPDAPKPLLTILNRPNFILNRTTLPLTEYSTRLAVSKDSTWLAVSTPTALNVLIDTNLTVYDTVYAIDHDNGFYSNFEKIDFNSENYDSFGYDTNAYDGTVLDTTLSPSASQGVVSLFKLVSGIYQYQYSICSPLATLLIEPHHEQFGDYCAFITQDNPDPTQESREVLMVSAPTRVSNKTSGALYLFELKTFEDNNSQEELFVPFGTTVKWAYTGELFFYTEEEHQEFAKKVAVDHATNTAAVTYKDQTVSKVLVYDCNTFDIVSSIDLEHSVVNSLALSSQGHVAATCLSNNNGVVKIFKDNTVSTVSNVYSNNSPRFGENIAFIEGRNTNTLSLVVLNPPTEYGFDSLHYDAGYYDNELRDTSKFNLNLVNVYDVYINEWVLSESLLSSETYFNEIKYGFATSNTAVYVGNTKYNEFGVVAEVKNTTNNRTWQLISRENNTIDISKIKKAFLYNKKNSTLVTHLDVIDCLNGKIPGIANQEIKFKTFYDPAVYNNNTTTIKGTEWNSKHVGMLWWDLRTAKFNDVFNLSTTEFNSSSFRNYNQNTLAHGASIDIYEWVESTMLPSEWDSIADTNEGVSLGISGHSLYSDEMYSVRTRYDVISNSFYNTYYFWVKNKALAPQHGSRKLSAKAISQLIANPRAEGYRYLAITSPNSFSLVNVDSYVNATDIALCIEYWLIDNVDQNIHTQWKLLSDSPVTKLPAQVESKWFDSICGQSRTQAIVPDMSLPVKLRYGILNNPRQSMFINRLHAIDLTFEYLNSVLEKHQIANIKNLSTLLKRDEPPAFGENQYDIIVDTYQELTNITPGFAAPASMQPVIDNGRIVAVTVTNPGRRYTGTVPYIDQHGVKIGYYGPVPNVIGSGHDAELISVISETGSLLSVDSTGKPLPLVLNPGFGYNNRTTISIRRYSALVNNDVDDNWAVYYYDNTQSAWVKHRVQAYDNKRYWKYKDWYEHGYSSKNIAKYSISSLNGLSQIPTTVGDIVKVVNGNKGKWMLLEKVSNKKTSSWTNNYKTIGVQDGTIHFLPNLHSEELRVGYDVALYDTIQYDEVAVSNIRHGLLETIRDDILTEDLKKEYIKLFFIGLRYAYSEQYYLDWAFKTSFVNIKHNIGAFEDSTSFRGNNHSDYNDYIQEVKPYRTKVREFVSCYNNIDHLNTMLTDFDLPPVYDNGVTHVLDTVFDGSTVLSNDAIINTYPWKHWYDNYTPTLIGFDIISPGVGYDSESVIIVDNNAAIATLQIENGKIVDVVLQQHDLKYFTAPQVVVSGSGSGAKIVAKIASPARSMNINMKFNNVSALPELTHYYFTDTLLGNNTDTVFFLTWRPGSNVRVHIDNVLISSKFYKVHYNYIRFDTPPANNANITVVYEINYSELTATERENLKFGTVAPIQPDNDCLIINGVLFNPRSGGSMSTGLCDIVSVEENDITLPAAPVVTLATPPNIGEVFNIFLKRLYTVHIPILDSITEYAVDNTAKIHQVYLEYMFNVSSIRKSTQWLTVPNIENVEVGNSITIGTEIKGVALSIQDNRVLLDSSEGIVADDVIKFDNNVYGGIVINKFYYVHDVEPGSISLKHSVTDTAPIELSNSSGTMPFRITGHLPFNTVVAEISNSRIKLSNPITRKIVSNTPVVVSKQLQYAVDYLISNSTITLTNQYSNEFSLNINGEYELERLDDEYYNMSWVVTETMEGLDALVTSEPHLLRPGIRVQFQGSAFGNVIPNIWYRVHSVIDSTKFRISTIGKLYPYTLVSEFGAMSVVPYTAETAVVNTFVGDGQTTIINLSDFTGQFENNHVILRNSSSDGSTKHITTNIDKVYSGGDLEYTTATGTEEDDLIINGDVFNSQCLAQPSELFTSRFRDTLAVKVYNKPTENTKLINANIAVETYTVSEPTDTVVISQEPNSPDALLIKATSTRKQIQFATPIQLATGTIITSSLASGIVHDVTNNIVTYTLTSERDFKKGSIVNAEGATLGKVTGVTLTKEYVMLPSTQYTCMGNRITFDPPLEDVELSIFSIGFSGGMYAVEYYITRNIESVITTSFAYSLISYKTPIVYVDGVLTTPIASEHPTNGALRLSFAQTLQPNVSVAIVLVDNDDYTFAITRKERFQGNGGTEYPLKFIAGESLPIEDNMFVVVNNKVLPFPDEFLTRDTYVYNSGSAPTITFRSEKMPNEFIEVVSSFKHDILGIERLYTTSSYKFEYAPNTIEYYRYSNIASGLVWLPKAVKQASDIWVTLNEELLAPNIDYRVDIPGQSIQIMKQTNSSDILDVITFDTNTVYHDISYMQFIDMLDRSHFKRLSARKRTRLKRPLLDTDTVIVLENGSEFESPNTSRNIPGVVEIRGERIEYFNIADNVLSQLRRGTLGTGIAAEYPVGTFVQDIGSRETIPYNNDVTIETQRYYRSNIAINTPLSVPNTSIYLNSQVTNEVRNSLANNIVDVIVGGYPEAVTWMPNTRYIEHSIIQHGAYQYECVTDHISSTEFVYDDEYWRHIKLNKVLRTNSYVSHNKNISPVSPDGDIEFDPDVMINRSENSITLNVRPEIGSKVFIVSKTGLDWNGQTSIRDYIGGDTTDQRTIIANFVSAEPGVSFSKIR